MSNNISFATEEEREFWNNSEYSVTWKSYDLLKHINQTPGYHADKLTTRGLYEYIYTVCGVQPGECLIKRHNNERTWGAGYGFTVEIRFVDAYTQSLFKLGGT